MSYQITLEIAEDSELGRLIENVAAREQLSREEAALKLSRSARNGASHVAEGEAEPTAAQETRRAAVEKVTGSLKGYPDLWQHFDDEHYEDIERENARDLI